MKTLPLEEIAELLLSGANLTRVLGWALVCAGMAFLLHWARQRGRRRG